ncbi:MAG: hypothetical protein ACI9XB_002644, partial [Gammaproteobacteria bacterium]
MSTIVNENNKQTVWDFWQVLDDANPGNVESTVRSAMAENVSWHGP